MTNCKHEFRDSTRCVLCGWAPHEPREQPTPDPRSLEDTIAGLIGTFRQQVADMRVHVEDVLHELQRVEAALTDAAAVFAQDREQQSGAASLPHDERGESGVF